MSSLRTKVATRIAPIDRASLIFFVCCLVGALLVSIGPITGIRILGGAALVFLLPGLALNGARDIRSSHDLLGHTAAVLATSIAATILFGFALAATHVFSRPALAWGLAALSLVVGSVRRWCTAVGRGGAANAEQAFQRSSGIVAGAGIAVAVIVAAAIAWAIHSTSANDRQASSVSLWAYDRDGKTVIGVTAGLSRSDEMVLRLVSNGRSVLLQVPALPPGQQHSWVIPTSGHGVHVQLLQGHKTLRTIEVA